MVTTRPYAPDRSMPSKSVVVPELSQVTTSDPSTEMSTVRTLVSPLCMADKSGGGGESLRARKTLHDSAGDIVLNGIDVDLISTTRSLQWAFVPTRKNPEYKNREN